MAELRPDGSDRFQVDLDEEYPVLERKYEFKRRVKWLARVQGLSPRNAFEDIACCPVCTQDKPAGEWTLREILHMEKHVLSPVVEYIEVHCVHYLHGFRICCRCLQYPKWEGKIYTIGGELFVSGGAVSPSLSDLNLPALSLFHATASSTDEGTGGLSSRDQMAEE